MPLGPVQIDRMLEPSEDHRADSIQEFAGQTRENGENQNLADQGFDRIIRGDRLDPPGVQNYFLREGKQTNLLMADS
jgi:hypothetical protein